MAEDDDPRTLFIVDEAEESGEGSGDDDDENEEGGDDPIVTEDAPITSKQRIRLIRQENKRKRAEEVEAIDDAQDMMIEAEGDTDKYEELKFEAAYKLANEMAVITGALSRKGRKVIPTPKAPEVQTFITDYAAPPPGAEPSMRMVEGDSQDAPTPPQPPPEPEPTYTAGAIRGQGTGKVV